MQQGEVVIVVAETSKAAKEEEVIVVGEKSKSAKVSKAKCKKTKAAKALGKTKATKVRLSGPPCSHS